MTREEREVRDRLILALDVPTEEEALRIVEETRGAVGMYKIGSPLFTRAGPDLVRDLVRHGERVFLDLKFHDIPTTVARAGIEAARLGVHMFTVHALGGDRMMRALVEAVTDFCTREGIALPRLLAVTVLTSLDARDLAQMFLRSDLGEVALELARRAHACGMGGVVASAHEVARIREAVPDLTFAIVVPGIRLGGAPTYDQKRSATPREALQAGADYLVLGRSVLESGRPREAIEEILRHLQEGSWE